MTNNPITMRDAAKYLGWNKPANTSAFRKRTGLVPVGVVGRAAVYNEAEVIKFGEKIKKEQRVKTSEISTPAYMQRLAEDMHAIVNNQVILADKIQALKDCITALHTESMAGHSLVADELTKIKIQLVELGPTA